MIGGVPVQVPSSAVSVWPSRAVPEIAGSDGVHRRRAATTAVAAVVAVALPAAFVAGDDDADVLPTSAG